MGILGTYWHKICEPLDGYLWHRHITHHLIRPVLRNQILISGAALLFGAVVYAAYPWLFWCGAGMICMTWIFWSWARFFLKIDLGQYSPAFLRAILLGFGLRLIIIAILLYMALAWAHASAQAILIGMVAGAFLAILNYGYHAIFLGRL